MKNEELERCKINAEEDYNTTPISVLRYITVLEQPHPPQTDLLRKAKDLIHVQFISTPLGNAESWEVFIKIEPTLIEIEQALKTKQTDDREDSKTVVLKEARELIQNYVDSGLTNVDIKNMLYRIDLALSEQALKQKGGKDE